MNQLTIDHRRTCQCPPNHLNCLTPKEWIKAQLGVWQFYYEGRDIRDKSLHPATYPLALATRCIELFTHRGELVLDPFVGSGTTLLSAQDSGRNAVGFDLNPGYIELCRRRLVRDHSRGDTYCHPERRAKDLLVDEACPCPTRRSLRGAQGRLFAALRMTTMAQDDSYHDPCGGAQVHDDGDPDGTRQRPNLGARASRPPDLAGETPALPAGGSAAYEDHIGGVLGQHELVPDAQQLAVCEDARNIGGYLGEETVSLILTSPPYANLLNRKRKNKSRRGEARYNDQYQQVEQYSQDPRDLGVLAIDDYKREMASVFRGLLPLLKPKGHCVVNVPDMWWENRRVAIHIAVVEALQSAGYELRNTIIWDRTNIVNRVGIFGWPSNYITMGVTFEYLLDFWRPPGA